MKNASVFFLSLFASSLVLFAGAPKPGSDLRETLTAAAQQKKMGFLLLGRDTCPNCNATRAMIRDAKIPVTNSNYVMADLNVDDQKVNAEFMAKYSREKFGQTLPFVVVTDSHGMALASSGGYKKPEEWIALLTTARAKAAKMAGGADKSGNSLGGAAGDPNWPFKSAAPAGL